MFPYDLDDLRVQALIGGTWRDITTDTVGPSGISITRANPPGQTRLRPARCALGIRNTDGKYTNRNPASPYFGLLGRNTQLRIAIAAAMDASGAAGETATSHVAPSVDLDGDGGLLVSVWLADGDAFGTFNYTTPGSMTAGTEVDETFSTSRSGREVLTVAGTTGTRTATTSATADRWAAVSVAIPGSITVQEVLQTSLFADAVTLTTGAGTQVGWWLLAVAGAGFLAAGSGHPLPPSGGPWFEVADSGFSTGSLGSRMRAWVRPVTAAGAQAVTVVRADNADLHLHVFVLSGVTGLAGQVAYRFWGEVPSWPQRWTTDTDVHMPIEVAGIMRRLDRPGIPLRSALFRAATAADSLPLLRAYWPLEDRTGASQFASGIGHDPMFFVGDEPSAASIEPFFGSSAVVSMGSSTTLFGDLRPYANTGVIAFRVLLETPDSGYAQGTRILDIHQTGGGTVRMWRLYYSIGGFLDIQALGAGGVQLDGEGPITMGMDGTQTMLGLDLAQDGADVNWRLFGRSVDADGTVSEGGLDGVFPGLTVGTATRVLIGSAGGMGGTAVGHLMIGDALTVADSLDAALTGHLGETAGDRMARLCAEESVPFTLVGAADDTPAMGPQGADSLVNLLHEARDVDGGILYEPRHRFGLAYRTLADLDNQTAAVSLDYAGLQVGVLQPDDAPVVNDYTASRTSGSSFRDIQQTGPLSIQEPPDGAGPHPGGDSYNVETDGQLVAIAGWQRHLGTWDEPLHTIGTPNFLTAAFNEVLAVRALSVDAGDLVEVTNPPPWLAPDVIRALAGGIDERLGNHSDQVGLSIVWSAVPAGPYHVFDLSETAGDDNAYLGYLVPESLVLAEALDTTETAVDVTTDGRWSTAADDWTPAVPLLVDGERIDVSAVGRVFADTFTRVTAGGWGTPDIGGAYTVLGTAADYSTSGTQGVIAPSATGSDRAAYVDIGTPDFDLTVDLFINALPASGTLRVGLAGRLTNSNNMYFVELQVSTTGDAPLVVRKRVAGALTALDTVAGFTITPAVKQRIRFQGIGPRLRAKSWPTGKGEPGWQSTVTDTDLTTGDNAGAFVRNQTAATTHTVTFDDLVTDSPMRLTVTRSANGEVKSHAAGATVDFASPGVLGP